jgi:methylmalonyl-CoA/ethylmalonyl-CoA epimerase
MSDDVRVLDMLHVGLAVPDPERMIELLGRFGFTPVSQEALEQEAAVSRLVSAGGVTLELLTPNGEAGPVARFLERRGPGLHHLCLRVSDIDAAIAVGRRAGLEFLDATPRKDSDGLRVFVHPRSFGGTLLGLVETN